MEKIISLFQRNYETDRLVRNEIVPGAGWVQDGEGVATEKIDGTSCMIRDGQMFKRYDAKPGRKPPAGFEQSGTADPVTGRVQGWVLVGDGPDDRWHREGFDRLREKITLGARDNGTYELVGPKVQGNPYGLERHELWRHGARRLEWLKATDFETLKAVLEQSPGVEGIVWHHPDGRMVKVKARDFGIRWPRPLS